MGCFPDTPKYKMGGLARNKLRKLESKNLRNINMSFIVPHLKHSEVCK